jgi:PAS domain S-box-containing protein
MVIEDKILQSVLDSLGEGVIVADMEGRFLYFNPVAERILGIGLKDIPLSGWSLTYGTFYPDRITPYPSEQLPLARAIKGETVTNELIFIKNPGRPEGLYIEVTGTPLRDFDGSITGGTVTLRDITNVKRAESSKVQSENRVKAQFRGNPIPTYVWQHRGDDFSLVDFNGAADSYTKGTIKNYMGMTLSRMYADSPDIIDDFWRCFNEKGTFSREITFKSPVMNGNRDLIVNYVFVPPDVILVHTEDISDRKRNEKELRQLSNAVEQTADTVIITDKHGVIEYVNPAFEGTTGYSREEAIGKTPKLLKSGKHDREFYHDLWDTILAGRPYRGTIVNRKKSGEIYWSEQTITPMKDEAGNVTHYVSVLKDITERRQKQEQEFQLRIARELQQLLYKSTISVPGFDIAGRSYSAVETNGDYFDLIPLPDGSIAMVIGDVSGHGIGAALVMAQARAYLRAFCQVESDPGKLLTRTNRELVATLDEVHYVTLILARLHPDHYTLDYSSAGHLPAYVLSKSGEVKHTMPSTGIPLGVQPDFEFSTGESVTLDPEDIVFLLTDGITEALAVDEKEFGYDMALDVMRSHSLEPAAKIIEHLYQAVRAFAHDLPQEDDITSIICKVNPKS